MVSAQKIKQNKKIIIFLMLNHWVKEKKDSQPWPPSCSGLSLSLPFAENWVFPPWHCLIDVASRRSTSVVSLSLILDCVCTMQAADLICLCREPLALSFSLGGLRSQESLVPDATSHRIRTVPVIVGLRPKRGCLKESRGLDQLKWPRVKWRSLVSGSTW